MQVLTTDLDGHPLGVAELDKAVDGRLRLNGEVVQAVRVIGSRVALLMLQRQVCVPATDYVRVQQSVANPPDP